MAEELEDTKILSIQIIQDHYASLNPGSMSEAEREVLNNDTLKAISDIKSATSIEEVNEILNKYLAKYPAPEITPDKPKNNNSTKIVLAIVIPSVSLLLIGLAVLIVILVLRRKKVH